MTDPLLTAADLALIGALGISSHRRLAGQATGEQRSPALGGGIEFADYREYVPGDDVRQIDWAVFLRFRKLMVKLAAEERELTVMVLVDTSASMAYGQPTKFRSARRVAAILAGIALRSGNRAGLLSWGSHLTSIHPPVRGERALPSLVERLVGLDAAAASAPRVCAREFATQFRRRCLAVLVTDLLHPDGPEVLAGLAASGCETFVVQVEAPEEVDPPFRGEVTLVDQETGRETALLADARILASYREARKAWLTQTAERCRALGLGWTLVRSDAPLEGLFRRDLVEAGLLC